MYKVVSTLAPFFCWNLFIIADNKDSYKGLDGSKFDKIRPGFRELAAFERLKKSPYTYNGRNVMSPLVLSFFNGSLAFLQVTRAIRKA